MFAWKDIALLAVVLCSMAGGIFLPQYGAFFQDYPLPLLMFLLFLSFLSVRLDDIWNILRRQKTVVVWLSFLKLLGLPLTVYALFLWVYPKYAIGAFLLTTMSTGVTAPFISSIVGGNSAFVVVMVALSSPLVPFTLPGLAGILLHRSIDISLLAMMRVLCLIIFIPLAAVEVLRRVTPGMLTSLFNARFPITMVIFALINLGVFSKYAPFFHQNPTTIIEAAGVALALGGIYLVAGLLALYRSPLDMQVASAISLCNINNVLVIVFAAEFFGPLEPTLGVLYMIPYYGVILPLRAYRSLRPSPVPGDGGWRT